jgi:quercetin dioxygenase-like cupin family protein
MVGSWQDVEASNAQETLDRQVIATQHLMVVRCRYPQGSTFPAHTHKQEQITIVEKGKLEFDVEGEAIEVGTGQMVSIFPGVSHSSRVVGDEPAEALNLFHNAPAS